LIGNDHARTRVGPLALRQLRFQQGQHTLPTGRRERLDLILLARQGRPDAAADAHETKAPLREIDSNFITP
jgi:hypothetical protein